MNIKQLILILLATGLFASCTPARQTTTTSVSGNPKMMIVAKLSVKPDKTKDFIAAAREIIEKSNKEEGCTFYQLYQDPYDPAKFVFVEEYRNQAAVDVHFAADYFTGFGAKIGDLVAGPAEIKIITVAGETIK
jgi:quinol monooxygenase YgiN